MKVKDAAIQAFPFIEPNDDDAIKAYHPGISLRDYFAVKAMQAGIGLIPNMKTPREGVTVPQAITEMAYEYADAMLKAREA